MMQQNIVQPASEVNRIYQCPKCSSNFDKFDEFNLHTKQGLCKGDAEKKAYCIAFKGSECTSAHKRINFTVDDYYYGHANGESSHKKRMCSKKFSCYSCGKVLRNNIRFMSHVRHKIENEWKDNDNVNDFNICSHCYRHYTSPFHLQCHIETVHATVPAATTCRICELNFENEQVFLMHMKDRHTYNEMPYICKICHYRTSFYHELTLHFRAVHENCASLLCPFCLAIHQTPNSYLTHVIQHMSKSVRCTQCRLQFFNVKDKTQHVESDHKSVFNSTGKRSLPKHPNEYMIFVKVSHHPLSPTKSNSAAQRKPVSPKPKPVMDKFLTAKDGWTFSSQYDPLIPLEYRPYARESRVFVVLSFEALRQSVTSCIECGDNLGVFVANYNKHFQREYRCRKCVFLSRCYKAIKKHILIFHLKQEYDPTKDIKPEDPIKLLMKKAMPVKEPPKQTIPSPVMNQAALRKGNNEYIPEVGINVNKTPESDLRRSSKAQTKANDTEKNDSIKVEASSDTSGFSDDEPETSKDTPAKTSPLSKSSPESSKESTENTSQKSAAKKRKLTDINSLLSMKEQEQENERASKQRRKQSKPQKVDVNEDTPMSSSQASSLDASKENVSSSVAPPPLDDNAFLDGMDLEDEPDEAKSREGSSSDRGTPPPKLKVKFASHLGLSKKKQNKTSPKPFVNPRSASHVFPPLPNLLTTSSDVMTSSGNFISSPPGMVTSSFRFATATTATTLSTLPKPSTSLRINSKPSVPRFMPSVPRLVNIRPISTVRVNPPAPHARFVIPSNISRAPIPTPNMVNKQQATTRPPKRTARKNVPHIKLPTLPKPSLPFGAQKMGGVLAKKTPDLSDLLNPPRMLSFSEVTNSSFLVSWTPPANTNLTEFKLVFQGAGLPTTQRLPAEQTSVRLIGLRSNTLYLVQLCSVYRFLQSVNIEGVQRTLGLRDHKKKVVPKKTSNDVIVLDDENDDVTIVPDKAKIQASSEPIDLDNIEMKTSAQKEADAPSSTPFSTTINALPKSRSDQPSKDVAPSVTISSVKNDEPESKDSADSETKDFPASPPPTKPTEYKIVQVTPHKVAVSEPTISTVANTITGFKVVSTSGGPKSLTTLTKSGTKSVIVVPNRNVKVKMIPSKPHHIDVLNSATKNSGASADPKSLPVVNKPLTSVNNKCDDSPSDKCDKFAADKLAPPKNSDNSASDKLALAQNTDDIVAPAKNADDIVALAQNTDDIVAPAKNADDIVAPAKNADDIVALAQNTDDIVAPAKNADDIAAPAKNADDIVAPAKNADDIAAPAKNADDIVAPAKNADDIAAPAKNTDDIVAPAKNADDIAAPAKNTDDIVAPAKNVDGIVAHIESATEKGKDAQHKIEENFEKSEEAALLEKETETKESSTTDSEVDSVVINGDKVEKALQSNAIEVSVDVHHSNISMKNQEKSHSSELKGLKCLETNSEQNTASSKPKDNVSAVQDQEDILEEVQDSSITETQTKTADDDQPLQNGSDLEVDPVPTELPKVPETNSSVIEDVLSSKSPEPDVTNDTISAAISKVQEDPSISNHVNAIDSGLSIAEKVRLASTGANSPKKVEIVKSADSTVSKDSVAVKLKAAAQVDTEKQVLSIQDLDNILSFLEEDD